MDILKTMKEEITPGLSITYFEEGVLTYTKSFGVVDNETNEKVTSNSIFHACSMSKMITAICILKLYQDNHINIFSDVNQYLKLWKFSSSDLKPDTVVTIADLLAHQGGISDPEGSFEPIQDNKIPKNIDVLRELSTCDSKKVFASYTPKTRFEYSDTGYAVLEMLIEDISGENYADFVTETIFKPLELEHIFLWLNDTNKVELSVVGHDSLGETVKGKRAVYPNVGGAGLWTTSMDFSKIIIDILKSFTNNTGLILRQEIAKLMFNPYGCVDYTGLGVFLGEYKGKPYFMSQGWGVGMQCKAITFLKEQTGAVVMMNSEPGKDQNESIVGMILREILNILL